MLLSIRYRSLTAPLLANPAIELGGMVGGSKHQLMVQATGACRQAILPWVMVDVNQEPVVEQARAAIAQAAQAGIHLPFVCKPDMGCRGSGVKLIKNTQQLTDVFAAYPVGVALVCQQLATHEPEVGIFYVRHPAQAQGEVASLTFKQTPSVVGDGVCTLGQLVAKDPRAAQLLNLYQERNQADWQRVLAAGERYRLLFSASHCRGAVFTDAREHITPALTAAVNHLMAGLPQFYYGRLDVKYADLAALKAGCTLEIIEINGASSESIHIWDGRARLGDAIKTLLWQYRTLFVLGVYQKKLGLKPPGLRALIKAWQKERALMRHYPATD